VDALPPVNSGQATTQLAEINAHGSPALDPLGDLTSVAAPDPDLAFDQDETDIDHDDPSRTQVTEQSSVAVEYPVQVTLEATPVNMAETTENPPVVQTSAEDEPLGEDEESSEATARTGSSESYDNLTNEELRDAIRARNAKGSDMKISGDKEELISRLQADDESRAS
jgi:hypothetical protein